MDSEFTYLIANDGDHEKIFVEIYCNEKFVALVSEEEGLQSMLLEFPGPRPVEELVCRKVDIIGFQQALERAMEILRSDE